MISVHEARQLVFQNCSPTKRASLPIIEANGQILAADVFALNDTPPFDQSAMDGYAFSFKDWDGQSPLVIAGAIPAGSFSTLPLQPSTAIRIFTGAPLPPGADTVVAQEKVTLNNNEIIINETGIFEKRNVRPKASQTKKGELALQERQLINPVAISFLASIGINKVEVFAKPIVSIIVTGNELVKPGDIITEGKIYESNSAGLMAALDQIKISPSSVDIVEDDLASIKKTITDQLKNDIIILTGGISVGDHDHVEKALEACGVKKIFHNVRQKPGKPFYFGTIGHTLIFALPGNPAAVLTCFYEYIVPAISQFTKQEYFEKRIIPLTDDFKKRQGYTYFLKGKTNGDTVSILPNQESYKMNSFAIADCLIELEEEKEFCEKGELVRVNMIV